MLESCYMQPMRHDPISYMQPKSPSQENWTGVTRILRYLKGTIDFALTYGRLEDWKPELTHYVDADGGTNPHRKSISGYVFTIAKGAVSWSSKKQSVTALSMAESKYVAVMHATKQLLWHRYLFNELNIPQPKKSILWFDNQATIAICHNPEFHARTKHINISLHFLCDYVEAGTMEIQYVPLHENLANIFTKRLPCQIHEYMTTGLGLLPVQGGVL